MKWADIVAANNQQIVLTTTPVKSTTTSVDALGDVSMLLGSVEHHRLPPRRMDRFFLVFIVCNTLLSYSCLTTLQVNAVAEKLAKARSAEVVDAKEVIKV